MGVFGLLPAIGLPWVTAVTWLFAWRPLMPWSLRLGYGFVLGIVSTTLLLRLQHGLGLQPAFLPPAAIFVALLLVGAGFVWRRRPTTQPDVKSASAMTAWEKCLYGIVLVLIVLRLLNLAAEVWLRPVYPWDAWTTWAVKPQVWFELGRIVPFVSAQEWLADRSHSLYTIDAWHYPNTIPLLQLWTALAVGEWNEPWNDTLWWFCALALGLGFYGQARVWGLALLPSLVFSYFLLSVPILNTHVALAGYADLWMAATFGLAMIAFYQWLRDGDPCQGILALLLALCCPLLKAEGAVWILVMLPALLAWLVGVRGFLTLSAGIAILAILWFWFDGFTLQIPVWGELVLTPQRMHIPTLGEATFELNIEWWPLVHNLFVLENWHLFWYLLCLLLLAASYRIVSDGKLFLYSLPVLSMFAILFLLFFATHAQQWNAQYTTINRLLLHVLPFLLFYALILFSDLQAVFHTRPSSAAQPA